MSSPAPTLPAPPFAWSGDEIRRVGNRVVDLIADHLTGLPDGPVFRPVPADLAAELLAAQPPLAGEPADATLDAFARDVAPYPFGNGHPRFYGWVNSPPAVMGVFASALAAAMNPSVAGGNHAAVWIERQVTGWFRELLGFPRGAMGLLVSGGSAAATTALAVARHVACARVGWDVRARGLGAGDAAAPRLVAYKGAEGHGCNQKAVELLGLGRDALRTVPDDGALRLRPDALDRMLRDDVAEGRVPMAVIASAGTVNTGAIDPLDELADVCAAHGDVWLHVDGAYGAPAVLTDAYRDALAPLARAHSVAMDPHKWLYAPVDAGLVLVRDGAAMRDAFSLVPPYLRTDDDERGVQGPPWLSEYGSEQTRPFRALKLWMTLRHFGVGGWRALIDADVALARRLAERLRALPGVEVWSPQALSIVCFRAAPAALPDERRDELNRAVLRDLQLGGEAFVSSTTLGGALWLRACIVNPRATAADVDALVAAFQAATARASETVEA